MTNPNEYAATFTLTETGSVLTETVQGIEMPADYTFATINDFVHRHDIVFDDLVFLCLGMAEYIDHLAIDNTLFKGNDMQRVTHETGKTGRYMHKKTGGIYSVICQAHHEKTGELCVVYFNEKTGDRWIRPVSEFNDGRFEPI
jgi:hypothetical protein